MFDLMAFTKKIYLLSQSNNSATELAFQLISQDLENFQHLGLTLEPLSWYVWKRQVESMAVGFWHVRLRGGAGGQKGAPAHVTRCRAHSALLMWDVLDKLVSAGCQLQRITSGSLACGHGP